MTTMAAIDRMIHHSMILDLMEVDSYRSTEASKLQLSNRKEGVLPLSVVDNSDFSANRLRALETLLMLASQGAYQAPHFKQ